MKRKVNKVGQNTLTISLPSIWVKDNNIKSGDELEIVSNGLNLIVGTESKDEIRKLEIELSNLDNMISRVISAIYKSGYDEVLIRYNSEKELEIIQKTINKSCHSFEIVDYSKDKLEIKSISSLDSRKFNLILKRLFYTLLDVSDNLINAMKNNDMELIKKIILIDKSIDNYSDFCRRLINKQKIDVNFNPITLYSIIEQLEVLGDCYKKLCDSILSIDLIPHEKLLITLLKDIENLIRLVQDILFKPGIDKIKLLGNFEIKIKNKLKELSKNKSLNFVIYARVLVLFDVAFDIKSPLLTTVI